MTVDHAVAEYILGYFMMCNRVWFNVDHIFFPIYIGKEKHWVLGVLHIKDCHIYVYNSLRGAKYNKAVLDCVRSYNVLLSLFFDIVNFWDHWYDVNVRSSVIELDYPFEITLIDELPTQDNKFLFLQILLFWSITDVFIFCWFSAYWCAVLLLEEERKNFQRFLY